MAASNLIRKDLVLKSNKSVFLSEDKTQIALKINSKILEQIKKSNHSIELLVEDLLADFLLKQLQGK
jgi:hypothetical protein